MQLVEQHVIAHGDQRFVAINAAAFQAKNLYNAAFSLVRQAFIFDHRSPPLPGRVSPDEGS